MSAQASSGTSSPSHAPRIKSASPPSSGASSSVHNGVGPKASGSVPHNNGRTGTTKLALLGLASMMTSLNVLVGRYTRSGIPPDEMYSVTHMVFLAEVFKFIIACSMEFYTTGDKLTNSLQKHVVDRPHDALKISIPTILYLVQNNLIYVALSNLTAPVFQVLYQGKLITIAILSVLMLQRKYSTQQWVCLVVLSIGVAIVALGEDQHKLGAAGAAATSIDDDETNLQNVAVGLTAIFVACFASSLGGVFLERVLKRQEASLWMRNIQLSFFSLLFAVAQGLFESLAGQREQAQATTSDNDTFSSKPYLHGFTFWVWVLVLVQSGAGLLSAAVMKYADNVKKGLSTGVSVISSSAFSVMLFGTPLTNEFFVGSFLILSAVYIFINPIKIRSPLSGVETELNRSLLPK